MKKKTTRIEEFKSLGCIIKKLEIKNMDIAFGNVKEVEGKIEEDKIDVLHSHCLRSNIVLSKIKVGKVKISTIHCNIKEDYKFAFGKIKGFLLEKYYLKSLNNIDYNICCSKSVYTEMIKITRKNLFYIENGVDLEKYKQGLSKLDSRKKLKLSENEKVFIVVGTLSKRKDCLFIAKEFDKIQLVNYKLIFLGEGEEFDEIKKINNKNIILEGKVSNVNEYLNASDFYISASNSEGMPNSVLEALANKLPVFLSNISSHVEIYNFNNKCGEIFSKNIDNSFNEKLLKLLENDYENMSENAYKIVAIFLNARVMSEKYEEYYGKGK